MADSLSAITGLSSGIDYRALVDAIIAAEHRPADNAQAQIDLTKKRQEAVKSWRDLLTTFRTAVDALRTSTGLDALSATATGETASGRTLFSAAPSSTARPGSYAIAVKQVATAQKIGSRTVGDAAAALGRSGMFTVNGAAITVDPTDSLTAIRDKINATAATETPAKVTAAILHVAPGDERLILTSQTMGNAGIARADTSGSVLADLALADAGAVVVDGKDAEFEIDGIPFTRTTNAVTDAIPGVTLTLAAAEDGTVGTLTVGRDAVAATAAVKAAVDAYNAAVSFLKAQATPGATNPPLYGDPMLRTARASLSRAMVGIIAGDEGNPVSGSAAGLSVSKTGVLSLTESVFTETFQASFDQMRALFTAGSGAVELDRTLDGALETNTGTVDVKSTFLTNRILQLQDRIDRIETRLDRRRTLLLQQFSQMEVSLGALQNQASFIMSQAAGFNRTTS